MISFKQYIYLIEASQDKLNLLKAHGFSEDQIGHIRASDPTDSKYIPWIAKHVKHGSIRLPEDKEKIHGQLKEFHRLKKSPRFTGSKDIHQYTPGSLYDTLETHRPEESNKTKSKNFGPIIHSEGPYKIHRITEPEHLMNASSGANWCTSQPKYASNYLEKGPSFVLTHHDKPILQLHPKSNQFMDTKDESVINEINRHIDNPHAIHMIVHGSKVSPEIHQYSKSIHIGDPMEAYHTEGADRSKSWYKNGQRHREGDKPAYKGADGYKSWYKNGQLHREGDKPAYEGADGYKSWWKNGLRYYPG